MAMEIKLTVVVLVVNQLLLLLLLNCASRLEKQSPHERPTTISKVENRIGKRPRGH